MGRDLTHEKVLPAEYLANFCQEMARHSGAPNNCKSRNPTFTIVFLQSAKENQQIASNLLADSCDLRDIGAVVNRHHKSNQSIK